MRILLIDDFRDFNADQTARNYEDGIKALQQEIWDGLYLDHDLGACVKCMKEGKTGLYCDCPKTGYDILCWLELNPQYLPKKIILVTSNPVGRERMKLVLDKLYKGEKL